MSSNKIEKALVGLLVEQALMEIGGNKLLDEVLRIIHEKFQGYLPDCYEHPEYLRTVFRELDADTSTVIIELLKKKLNEFSGQKQMKKFLSIISETKS